ncbi:hypothetical protein ACGFMK_48200 [Amycolatopsis sp. NPDC049252]|uniref:hypothetical protein n=1 Tax=Amycolatopsis sp. NPDC049252 TaxID=3363933 RepID=UPI003714CC95
MDGAEPVGVPGASEHAGPFLGQGSPGGGDVAVVDGVAAIESVSLTHDVAARSSGNPPSPTP